MESLLPNWNFCSWQDSDQAQEAPGIAQKSSAKPILSLIYEISSAHVVIQKARSIDGVGIDRGLRQFESQIDRGDVPRDWRILDKGSRFRVKQSLERIRGSRKGVCKFLQKIKNVIHRSTVEHLWDVVPVAVGAWLLHAGVALLPVDGHDLLVHGQLEGENFLQTLATAVVSVIFHNAVQEVQMILSQWSVLIFAGLGFCTLLNLSRCELDFRQLGSRCWFSGDISKQTNLLIAFFW